MTSVSPPKIHLNELVANLDVTIEGDKDIWISGISTIQQGSPGTLTFLINPRYKKYLASTKSSAVILSRRDAVDCSVTRIISRDPYYTYAKMAAYFLPKLQFDAGVHASAQVHASSCIHPTARIGANCVISGKVTIGAQAILGPGCFVGEGSTIDEDSYLHPNVTVYHGIRIGKRVIIASGTVIGADGFGIAKHGGVWHKVPQLGGVLIEDDVEIGANSAIDRGAIDDTVIEAGAKLDNLIQVGHNVRIGAHTAIAGCVGIAGSTEIGKNCLLGGGSGVAGHIKIADDVMVTGMTAVTSSIHEAGIYSSGAGGVVPNKAWQKNSARLRHLDELHHRVKQLEATLQALVDGD
jgi:UDP-3-O-[3-hydroxymyristoyl] glucosamine N-acyltransferase